jgi:pimeloyl-ACP methyl ester carboxylesterase
VEKWSSLGVYARVKPLEHLSKRFTCIAFDRRECGQSGGRLERVTWAHYVAQGAALLDHLNIDRALLMGGCMGCAPVAAFAVAHPERVAGIVLWWPVGGAKYRIKGQARFAEHLDFVEREGLHAVVDLVLREGKAFGADPRGGPFASVIKRDASFARAFAAQDAEDYKRIIQGMARGLLDRDTAPGAEPEDLMGLSVPAWIVPGRDESHATSAARYLEECIPGAEYWDVPPAEQTEDSANPKLIEFLERAWGGPR